MARADSSCFEPVTYLPCFTFTSAVWRAKESSLLEPTFVYSNVCSCADEAVRHYQAAVVFPALSREEEVLEAGQAVLTAGQRDTRLLLMLRPTVVYTKLHSTHPQDRNTPEFLSSFDCVQESTQTLFPPMSTEQRPQAPEGSGPWTVKES
ncbi:unnamed protein product [Leuciscus chuanchicus]